MRAPETIETARLLLRRPQPSDAEGIFRRYASDPAVTRFLSWPTHRGVEETRAYLAWSDRQWEDWPAGPYLILARDGRAEPLLGGTGLAFESPTCAATGYVFAPDAWGQGFATEAVRAMIEVARLTGVQRLEAICHTAHAASAHVLIKCGFTLIGILGAHTVFPNIEPGSRLDVLSFACEPSL
ncbi:MAG: GNAT family N-acetyltransferase [Terracidiphilus sp.]